MSHPPLNPQQVSRRVTGLVQLTYIKRQGSKGGGAAPLLNPGRRDEPSLLKPPASVTSYDRLGAVDIHKKAGLEGGRRRPPS